MHLRFLGWTTGSDDNDLHWRQLRDLKWSPDLSTLRPDGLVRYAETCGRALALAHARGGNRVAIAGYIGQGTAFADAFVTFGHDYAGQDEADFGGMSAARSDGRLPTIDEPVQERPFPSGRRDARRGPRRAPFERPAQPSPGVRFASVHERTWRKWR